MDLKTVILPDHDDLLRRLAAVDNQPHLVEKFYPLILKLAGREQAGLGLATALTLAAFDYTADFPPILASVVHLRLPDFARAIIDDPQVQADAIAGLQ